MSVSSITFSRNGSDVGGPFVWTQRFIRFLRAQGVTVLETKHKSAKILCIVGGGTITEAEVAEYKKNKTKIVIRIGGVYLPFQRRSSRQLHHSMLLNAKIIELADHVFYNSAFGKGLSDEFLLPCPREKCSIIPNGVDPGVFNPSHKLESPWMKQIGTGNFVIGAIAHWRETFRLEQFMDTIKPTLKLIPNAKFVIAGKKNQTVQEMLEKFVKDNKLEKVVIDINSITQEQVCLVWPCFDVFLHTRWSDCGPNSIIEALASGVPVVTNNFSAGEELIKGAGVVYNYTNNPREEVGKINPQEVAEKIAIVRNDIDSYKKKARLVATSNYNANLLFSKYYEVLQKL